MIFRRQPLTPEHYRYVRRLSETLARGDGHFADEIEQDTLVAAVSTDRSEVRSIRAWLTGIARNVSNGRRRSANSGPRFVALKNSVETHTRLVDPAEAATEAELRTGIARILKTLPAEFAEVVTLRVYEDLPPREIAIRLDLGIETVRSRLRRGLALLKVAVERDLSDHVDQRFRAGVGFSAFGRWEWAIGGGILASLAIVTAILLGREEPQSDEGGTLVGSAALEARAPESGRVTLNATREPIPVAGISATVRNGTTVIETREFEAGERAWEIQMPLRQNLTVHVVDENEQPVAGARIFSQDSAWGLAHEVAITDADGNARVAPAGRSHWLAASFQGGMRSESIQIDQLSPRTEVELSLLRYQAHPHRFVLADEVGARVHQIRAVKPNWRSRFGLTPGKGLTGPACWIPLERDSDGRYLVLGDLPIIIEFLDRSGKALALLAHNPRKAQEVIKVGGRGPTDISGRLLGYDSRAVPHANLSLVPVGFSGRVFDRARTDELGRFQFDCVPSFRWKIVEDGETLISFDEESQLEPTDSGLSLGDVVVNRDSVDGTVVGEFGRKRLYALRGAYPASTVSSALAGVAAELTPIDVSDNGAFCLEGAELEGIRALVVTEPDLKGAVAAVIHCPVDGWTAEPLTIMADESHTVAVECSIARNLLPARVVALDAHGPFTQRVDVNNATGELTGLQLCAGEWNLAVLAVDGALHQFRVSCPAGRRDPLKLGCLTEDLGTVRVLPPTDSAVFTEGMDEVTLQMFWKSKPVQQKRLPLAALLDGSTSLQLPLGPVLIEMRRGVRTFFARTIVKAGQSVDVTLERMQPTARIILKSDVDPLDTLDLTFLDEDGRTLGEVQIQHAVASRGTIFDVVIPAISSGTIELASTSGRLRWSIPIRRYQDVQTVSGRRNRRLHPSAPPW